MIPFHTRYIHLHVTSNVAVVIVSRTLLLGLHTIPSATTEGQKQGQRDDERGAGTKGQGQRDRNRGTNVCVVFLCKNFFLACWFLWKVILLPEYFTIYGITTLVNTITCIGFHNSSSASNANGIGVLPWSAPVVHSSDFVVQLHPRSIVCSRR